MPSSPFSAEFTICSSYVAVAARDDVTVAHLSLSLSAISVPNFGIFP
jgi:hypothetical protein